MKVISKCNRFDFNITDHKNDIKKITVKKYSAFHGVMKGLFANVFESFLPQNYGVLKVQDGKKTLYLDKTSLIKHLCEEGMKGLDPKQLDQLKRSRIIGQKLSDYIHKTTSITDKQQICALTNLTLMFQEFSRLRDRQQLTYPVNTNEAENQMALSFEEIKPKWWKIQDLMKQVVPSGTPVRVYECEGGVKLDFRYSYWVQLIQNEGNEKDSKFDKLMSLMEREQIAILDLSGTDINKLTPNNFSRFLQYLEKTRALRELNILGCELKVDQIQNIQEILKKKKTITGDAFARWFY